MKVTFAKTGSKGKGRSPKRMEWCMMGNGKRVWNMGGGRKF